MENSWQLRGVTAAVALAVLLTGCGAGDGSKMKTNVQNPVETTIQEEGAMTASKVTADNLHEKILAGEYRAIYDQTSQEFQQQVSLANLEQAMKADLANITELESTSKLLLNGGDMRVWADKDHTLSITAMFDTEGIIAGLRLKNITLPEQAPPQQTKQLYQYPFADEWFVFWGGDNVMVNYHYAYETQRFAYDFLVAKDGFTYEGDPLKNESYHAFGLPILAPADGVVVEVVNDVVDNEPVGVMNEKEPVGNVVVIDHGGEFSIIAHLKQGSAKVAVGDTVKQGDVVGLAGNSGNSSEAHLHYQVSDGADVFTAKSLDIQWENGQKPIQGDQLTGQQK